MTQITEMSLTAGGVEMAAQSAEWWEEQAGRYKAELSAVQRELNALHAEQNAEIGQLRLQLAADRRAYEETLVGLRSELTAAKALAEQRRSALAEVFGVMRVAVERALPLLSE